VILSLDGAGRAETFADYAQWEAVRAARSPARDISESTRGATARERPRTKRLGYQEQRDWDRMEDAILESEAALAACQCAAEDPTIAADAALLQERYAALEAARAEVDRLYARWAELAEKLRGE
jgi:ATP-binding cassette subfamily F protein uup